MKNTTTIAHQIEKAEELVLKRKAAYDEAVSDLKVLREKEQKEKQQALLNAVAKSSRTYDDIMRFLQSTPDEDEE